MSLCGIHKSNRQDIHVHKVNAALFNPAMRQHPERAHHLMIMLAPLKLKDTFDVFHFYFTLTGAALVMRHV